VEYVGCCSATDSCGFHGKDLFVDKCETGPEVFGEVVSSVTSESSEKDGNSGDVRESDVNRGVNMVLEVDADVNGMIPGIGSVYTDVVVRGVMHEVNIECGIGRQGVADNDVNAEDETDCSWKN